MNNIIKTVAQDEVGTSMLSYGIDCGLNISKPEENNFTQNVEAAHKRILISRDKANSNTIELCYRLYHLNSIAKESNKDTFWLEYFDVVNFTEYCERKLDISTSLGSQYLMAGRCIERLKPEYLKSIFDNNDGIEAFPPIGYTRFRAVNKFVPIILEMKGSAEFTRLVNLIFNQEESNSSVLAKLRESLKTLLSQETKDDLPIKARLKKIESLRKRLVKVLDDVKDFLSISEGELIDNIYDEIKSLLNEQPIVPDIDDKMMGFDEPAEGEVPMVRRPEWMCNELDSEAEARADDDLSVVLPGFN